MKRVNQVRTALLIQMLHSFASGILAVALPLMMEERKINIVLIGFVFASMPLIMQFGRMFFATVSDFLGRKLFFVLNGFLGVVSSFIYYYAFTPLEFLFGKVTEGTKDGTIWAVNRAFLLEKSEMKLRILVHLQTVVCFAYAFGNLLAGFFLVWFFYKGTMIFCGLAGACGVFLSFLLVNKRNERFNMTKALRFLDFRRKERVFKIFLFSFFLMGLAFGFQSSYVLPLFLKANGFVAETVGVIIGVQILLTGVVSYLFGRRVKLDKIIILSGVCYSATFLLLGFSSSILAASLVITLGLAQGFVIVGQEGILSQITDKASYGTDIGLLMMGLNCGEALSLALTGLLISAWGFAIPFLLSATIFALFCLVAYSILKK